MRRSELYEAFHRKSSPQVKIIDQKNFTYRNLLKILDRYLDKKERVLDIGCGSGVISLYLAFKGMQVLGIDISEKSIRVCKTGARQLNLEHRASFRVMDFSDQTPNSKFDLIVCSEVLEHIENDEKAIKQIYNLLKPSGILIISVPSVNAPLYKWGLADKFDLKVGHLRRYTLGQLTKLCSIFGFKILETRKTEGILRNFLFLNPIAGKTIKFMKGPISDLVVFIDDITLKIFCESQLFVVAEKA